MILLYNNIISLYTFFQPFYNLPHSFTTRSISRHLASRYLVRHFYIQLLIFFRELTRQNHEFSHDFCPRLDQSYAIDIYVYFYVYVYNNSVTPERVHGSCKSASVFRLCNYCEAKLIRHRRSRFVSRRRQYSNPHVGFLALEGGTDDTKVPETIHTRCAFSFSPLSPLSLSLQIFILYNVNSKIHIKVLKNNNILTFKKYISFHIYYFNIILNFIFCILISIFYYIKKLILLTKF